MTAEAEEGTGRSLCPRLTNTTVTYGRHAPTTCGIRRFEPWRSRPYGLRGDAWSMRRVGHRAEVDEIGSVMGTARRRCGKGVVGADGIGRAHQEVDLVPVDPAH
jgi:hypothetical protein